ncbi:hypothetical protein [Phyllobacterium sp. P5_D12]
MEGWLKGLIAVACVVVIAGGGYFGFTQYQDYATRKERSERRAGAEDELFRLAQTDRSHPEKVREFCKGISINEQLKANEVAMGVVNNCRILGYL